MPSLRSRIRRSALFLTAAVAGCGSSPPGMGAADMAMGMAAGDLAQPAPSDGAMAASYGISVTVSLADRVGDGEGKIPMASNVHVMLYRGGKMVGTVKGVGKVAAGVGKLDLVSFDETINDGEETGSTTFPEGDYSIYVWFGPDGDSAVKPGSLGYFEAFQVKGGAKALTIHAGNALTTFKATIEVTTDPKAPDGRTVGCVFFPPGSRYQSGISDIWAPAYALTFSKELMGGVGTADFGPKNAVIPGAYDLYCRAAGNPMDRWWAKAQPGDWIGTLPSFKVSAGMALAVTLKKI